MTISELNLNQTPEELNAIYAQDYYWYLKSPQFHDAFLEPMGQAIQWLGGETCLDVACGEGQLARHVQGRYTGVDGSQEAIRAAMRANPLAEFHVARMEAITELPGFKVRKFDTIIFGGVLQVLIKEDQRLDFVKRYVRSFKPELIVVYDLEMFDSSILKAEFGRPSFEYHNTVDMPNLQDVKRSRQVLAFSL